MSKLKIVPVSHVSSYKTGRIVGLTKAEIDALLGFKPNMVDDPSKVKHSWGFKVKGNDCAIWDWKGSHKLKEWSAYGPETVMRAIFGANYVSGAY
jgi:hypothetical protein